VDFAPLALRRQANEELLARALARSDAARSLVALARLAMDQASSGEFAAWDRSVDRLLELAAQAGDPRQRWRPLLHGSMRACAKGDVRESERLLVEVRELAALTDDPALALSLDAHAGQRAILLHLDDQLSQLVSLKHLRDVPHAPLVRVLLKALAHARLEEPEPLQRELAQLPPLPPALPRIWLAWLVEACALAGDLPRCRQIRAELEPHESEQLVGGHVPLSYEGPLRRLLGMLDSVLGDHARAEQRLRAALAQMEEHGLRAWVAQVRYDLARALLRAGQAAEARALFGQTAELAERLGMPGLAERARHQAAQPEAAQPADPAAPPSAAARTAALAPVPAAALRMLREGDVWLVQQGARFARVKNSRGLVLLSRLVERPGEDIHVLALASDDPGASLQDTRVAGLDAPDARALREYKQRLSELSGELAEAEQAGQLGHAERLSSEREQLETELSRALGLGGAARAGGSPAERARVNVQRRLKDAIARVTECDGELGRYLERAVVTGTYCRFLA
jgi:hypothetical protein